MTVVGLFNNSIWLFTKNLNDYIEKKEPEKIKVSLFYSIEIPASWTKNSWFNDKQVGNLFT